MKKITLPLSGIKIVDFSRLLPGPWATQMLAELGAEVYKVEEPEIGIQVDIHIHDIKKIAYIFMPQMGVRKVLWSI